MPHMIFGPYGADTCDGSVLQFVLSPCDQLVLHGASHQGKVGAVSRNSYDKVVVFLGLLLRVFESLSVC